MKNPKPPTLREKRKAYIQSRLAFFNEHYHFSWNRVTVKNMKSRLGSCSSLKNLNFASKLFSYPPEVIDYVIVHELCHLKEMNHSKRFYALISETIPDWKIQRFKIKDLRIKNTNEQISRSFFSKILNLKS